MTLADIAKPIKNDLDQFNSFFKKQLKTEVALLDLVLKYITKKKGKQIRPILVLLSSGLCGNINQRAYIGASLVELLHTATLIHDDVVDEADERRGIATINVSWNNKIAVLIGDFLLSKGLLTSIDNNEFEFLKITSTAVKRMSEGELLSIENSRKVDTSEETYFKIISDKTASLMASCTEIGARAVTDDPDTLKKLRDFGEYLGIAFQLKDDLFDYTTKSSIIGKPVGIDIKEKKLTLPIIYALQQIEPNEAKKIVKKIKKGKLKTSEVKEIIDFVNEKGGVEYTKQKAYSYIDKAKDLIKDFPDSDYKKSLYNLSDFIIDRNS